MKSLTSIDEILHNHSEIRDTSAAFFDENTNFPLNIEGLHGSLFTYFTAEVCRSNHLKALQAEQYSNSSKKTPQYKIYSSDLIIVVPTETDARDIAEDFSAILSISGAIAPPSFPKAERILAYVSPVLSNASAKAFSKLITD